MAESFPKVGDAVEVKCCRRRCNGALTRVVLGRAKNFPCRFADYLWTVSRKKGEMKFFQLIEGAKCSYCGKLLTHAVVKLFSRRIEIIGYGTREMEV